MKENVFNVCRRGTAKKNAMVQVPDGYLTADRREIR